MGARLGQGDRIALAFDELAAGYPPPADRRWELAGRSRTDPNIAAKVE
jgi:hypothetical protein